MKLIIACLIVAVLFFAIGYLVNEYKIKNDSEVKASNPVTYFEIPVTDMERAMQFYGNVLGYSFTRQSIHGNDMAFFPFDESKPGITGALAKGEIYQPTHSGTLVYFSVDDIDLIMQKALANGGKQLFPKTAVEGAGFVAEIEDSEGNRVGLFK